MRRLCLILLCGLVVVPAALAAPRATGDGVLELIAVNADRVTIVARGAIWGQLDRGTLIVYDRSPQDSSTPYVSGAEISYPTLDGSGTVYKGRDIHFRSTDGAYRFVISGSGIDLTAVGSGKAYIDGNADAIDMGQYAVDNNDPQPVQPRLKIVPFGAQPTATSGSTTSGP